MHLGGGVAVPGDDRVEVMQDGVTIELGGGSLGAKGMSGKDCDSETSAGYRAMDEQVSNVMDEIGALWRTRLHASLSVGDFEVTAAR